MGENGQSPIVQHVGWDGAWTEKNTYSLYSYAIANHGG